MTTIIEDANENGIPFVLRLLLFVLSLVILHHASWRVLFPSAQSFDDFHFGTYCAYV